MVIKIFYFFIALFSVVMVFLSVQTPYVAELFNGDDSKIATIEMHGIDDYEITNDKITAKFSAKSGERFSNKDVFSDFVADKIFDDLNHTITSKNAELTKNLAVAYGNAHYKNSDNIEYFSDKISYDMQKHVVFSDTNFTMTKGMDKIEGAKIRYEIEKKQTFAKGVKGWFWEKK